MFNNSRTFFNFIFDFTTIAIHCSGKQDLKFKENILRILWEKTKKNNFTLRNLNEL
jgi:hypothetical protein